MGLYSIDERSGVVRLGVDSTNEVSLSDRGRPSIRIESKATYDHGLFIADFLHMPPSHCGLWPAFWTYGDNWPYDGEIDIIEGVNTAHTNILSAHTADGCTQSPTIDGLYSGQLINTECAVGENNIGCGFHPSAEDTSSYGDGFNAAHGGVYAMEWDSVHIRIWHFARGEIPRDIEDKRPDPETWGLPIAVFGGESCDVDEYFKRMRLVLNINFCGDYGNAVWGITDQCNAFAPTCPEYVASHPEAFANAYWDVRYIDAYQLRIGGHRPHPGHPKNPDRPHHSEQPDQPDQPDEWHQPDHPDQWGRPDHPSDPDSWRNEQVTTTTMTTRWTETVTAYATGYHPQSPQDVDNNDGWRDHVPAHTTAAIEPVATRAPVNPVKINDYSYLGCFYSSTDFPCFTEVVDSLDMTLETCIEFCRPRTYAAVFDSHCFCADDLDAGTRAAEREGLCNRECPGNKLELCGGLIGPRDNDGPREKFATDETPRHALTVYAFVAEERPEQPPAMAPGSNGPWRNEWENWESEDEGTATEVEEVSVFPVSEEDDSKWKGGDWEHNGEDGYPWNKQWGDWKESPTEDQDKPAITEVVVSVTETVVDCPEETPTKEAVVIPTWLPPVEPKPWVASDPSDPPSPPPAGPQHNDDDHSHYDVAPPPHEDYDKSHHDPLPPPPPPPPPPAAHNETNNHFHPSSTSPDSPVNTFVLVAAASTVYGEVGRYFAIMGSGVLFLVMGLL
ncbi:hypothetical protein A9Z42_0085750 [Trichoderma parareesei]|uniref:GH16 domain-containing protein n=1 Tax=Trichoderma parareesei TaxID=858221 RepID=A0A2H2ZJY3_TRIPA|nr:hypothetical protein A9Z42_0085750 [Trichoderma parareesei]